MSFFDTPHTLYRQSLNTLSKLSTLLCSFVCTSLNKTLTKLETITGGGSVNYKSALSALLICSILLPAHQARAYEVSVSKARPSISVFTNEDIQQSIIKYNQAVSLFSKNRDKRELLENLSLLLSEQKTKELLKTKLLNIDELPSLEIKNIKGQDRLYFSFQKHPSTQYISFSVEKLKDGFLESEEKSLELAALQYIARENPVLFLESVIDFFSKSTDTALLQILYRYLDQIVPQAHADVALALILGVAFFGAMFSNSSSATSSVAASEESPRITIPPAPNRTPAQSTVTAQTKSTARSAETPKAPPYQARFLAPVANHTRPTAKAAFTYPPASSYIQTANAHGSLEQIANYVSEKNMPEKENYLDGKGVSDVLKTLSSTSNTKSRVEGIGKCLRYTKMQAMLAGDLKYYPKEQKACNIAPKLKEQGYSCQVKALNQARARDIAIYPCSMPNTDGNGHAEWIISNINGNVQASSDYQTTYWNPTQELTVCSPPSRYIRSVALPILASR